MKILITGGNGFVGKPIVEYLLSQKHKVTVLDISSENLKELPDLNMVLGSVEDKELVKEVIRDVDVVYHLALTFSDDIREFINSNINGTLNLLEASKLSKIKHFLFSSSQAVYGEGEYLPVDEKHPCNPGKLPIGPKVEYGVVKLTTENLCIFYHHNYKLPVTVFRISGVYGGLYNHIKPPRYELVKKVLNNKDVKISKKSGGEYIHVKDVAGAFSFATLNKKAIGEIFNLSAFFIPNHELIKFLVQQLGSKSKIKLIPDKESLKLNTSKIQTVLKFKPKYNKAHFKKHLVEISRTIT